MRVSDIIVDCLTFPIATGQEETRRDALETIEAIRAVKQRYPEVQTTLGISNVSFGLNPAARAVLNSVFLDECVRAGLDSAIVHAVPDHADRPDPGRAAAGRAGPGLRPPAGRATTRWPGCWSCSRAWTRPRVKASRAAELAGLPLWERLKRRIIDGERVGLEADLDEALAERPALEIVNDVLLDGMKTVGELFGSGQMQLPFVLTSAEVMKLAVGYLEPHMERSGEAGKGRIVLATVRGDVHDIGKNLVDIILSNNGYDVVNIGIKQPLSAIVDAATEHGADVIGMSGLLVKSTVVMRDNLAELNSAGPGRPLAGAARRRRADPRLRGAGPGRPVRRRGPLRPGRVRGAAADGRVHGRQARRGGRRAAAAAGAPGAQPGPGCGSPSPAAMPARSDVATDNPVPVPPFFGDRVVKGIPLADYAAFLDERATFLGQWGLKPSRGGGGPSYEELVETEGRPRLRMWLDRMQTEGLVRGRRWSTATSRRSARATTWWCWTTAGRSGSGSASRASATTGTCAWPTSSGPAAPASPTWSAFQLVTVGPNDQRGDRGAVRQGRLPRVPGAARAVRAARRGAGRVLARAGSGRRLGLAAVRPGRPGRHPEGRLPRLPVLVRLPGLPGPGGPGQGGRAAAPRSGSG